MLKPIQAPPVIIRCISARYKSTRLLSAMRKRCRVVLGICFVLFLSVSCSQSSTLQECTTINEKLTGIEPYVLKAIDTADTAQHTIYMMKGNEYVQAGDFQKGVQMLYKALNLVIQTQNLPQRATMYNLLSEAYRELRDVEKSEFYLNRVLEVTPLDSLPLQVATLRNLAYIYASRGDMAQFEATMSRLGTFHYYLHKQQCSKGLQKSSIEHETEQITIRQDEAMQTKYRSVIYATLLLCMCSITIVLRKKRTKRGTCSAQQPDEPLADDEAKKLEDLLSNLNGAMKKLSESLLHLFDEEKIYRQPQLTIEDVAKELGISTNRLSLLLNQGYKASFPDFVNLYRIDEAKELLLKQEEGSEYMHYTIQAVAEMVGFWSLSSFYTAFKQVVGVTPREYREGVRGDDSIRVICVPP